jgi:glycosyltransferase involved in cell wall biosynthesis/ADP-heptose:LPS heptosyltransferase/Flp pilus assembly protein TadD
MWVNSAESLAIALDSVRRRDLRSITLEAGEFKENLMSRYLEVLRAPFGIDSPAIEGKGARSWEIDAGNDTPVHFFTIVLNGEPYIRYHLEILKQLPFRWHWHLIEGVADLKHDTAWSVPHGGCLPPAAHDNGLSSDGTTAYLDLIASAYPGKVSLYRKPAGIFWDGKLEMVNAPLERISERCLLWQLDVDELWTVEQLCAGRALFLKQPEKTAAYYYCHFFVGPDLVITSRDTYGNHTGYEWLRTWRFTPGLRWTAHEPPRLCSTDGVDLAMVDPLRHAETEAAGLVFQHFAYALESQVAFKEKYYGYRDGVTHWRRLQELSEFPALLREFLPWVGDGSTVDTVTACKVTPLIQLPKRRPGSSSPTGAFQSSERLQQDPAAGVDPTHIKSLLFLRPDSIGDNVMAASMLPHLKERYRAAKITVFCQQRVAELYEASPLVHSVIGFDPLKAYRNQQYRDLILQRLKSLGADLALNPLYSREPLYDLFAIGSGARTRVAFHGNLCNIPEEVRDRNDGYYTVVIGDDGAPRTEMDYHRHYLAALGIAAPPLTPLLWTTADDEQHADEFFAANGLVPARSVALLPCGQWGEKTYSHYGEALADICREHELTVLAIGTSGEAQAAANILAAIGAPAHNLAGATTLRQSAAILKRCRLAIGADTGTAHIACAVGTPQVVILGGGHFGRFFPYCALTSVVSLPLACYQCNWSCGYGRAHCLRDVDPAVLARAVTEALAGRSEKPRVYLQSRSPWRPDAGGPAWQDCSGYLDTAAVDITMVGGEESRQIGGGRSAPVAAALTGDVPGSAEKSYLVSAIVSTYNAERLLRGKLEDLEAQTAAGELEIIVVDSGSQQNERGIVEEFQLRYDNIRYIRTQERETVYQAWNRGIRAARGEFVTNANTDDRLSRDAIELLVRALREHPECVLAYCDMRITEQENGTFDTPPSGCQKWQEFDRFSLLELCCVGPFPLWRRSLHGEIGYFDERYRSAADYEFWLRAALKHDFIHVPKFLGLYYLGPDTVSRKGELPKVEYLHVQHDYRRKYAPLAAPPVELTPHDESEYEKVTALFPVGVPERVAVLQRFAERHPRWPRVHHDLAEHHLGEGNLGHAKMHFEKAALLAPLSPLHMEALQAFLKTELYLSLRHHSVPPTPVGDELERQLILGMICNTLERPEAARNFYLRALEIDPHDGAARANLSWLDDSGTTSIVVVASGDLDQTKECLESIARNTPEPHEVIVVEAGCAFSHACNLGMSRSKGCRIVLMRSHVVATPGWLSGMLTALEREGAALVAPMTNGSAPPQGVCGTSYRDIAELEVFARDFRIANSGRRLAVERIDGFCLLFTRSLADAAGGFDDRFVSSRFAVEDFQLRASLGGGTCTVAGDVFVHSHGIPWDDEVRSATDRAAFEQKWRLDTLEESLAGKVLTRRAVVEGSRLARQGHLNEGVDLLLQQGIACSPKNPAPYLLLAQTLAEAGKLPEALEVLGQVPPGEEFRTSLLLAETLQGLRRGDEASEHAEKALRAQPGSAAALRLQADLAAVRGDVQDAERLYRVAIEADPGFGPAFTGLAALAWERGEREEALRLAETGFVLSPLGMTPLDRFHRYAEAMDELPREERRVREAIAVYPAHRGLAFGLVEILIRRRCYGTALDEIQRCAAAFGLDDGAMDAALEIRSLAGAPPAPRRGSSSISICMIVKNEAQNLPSALLSVKGLADDLVVVDTGSTDRTCDLASIFGARVFSFTWNGNFSDARNFSFSKALGDWIMVMDPDEMFSPRDLPRVRTLLQQSTTAEAYALPIRNYTHEVARQDWHPNSGEYPEERGCGWTMVERARIFPNDSRIQYQGAVHELLEPSLSRCGIPVHNCDIPVHHYGKLDAARYAEKQVQYYELGMKKLADSPGELQPLAELALQATELQRFEEAEPLWQRVLQARPECVEAHFNLSYLYLATAAYQKARAHALRASELAPEMKEAWFNLGKAELFVGDVTSVLTRCEFLLRNWPDHPPAMSLLCAVLVIDGRRDEAERLLDKIRRLGFDCCDFLEEYADGLRKGGRSDLSEPLGALAATLAAGHGGLAGDGAATSCRHVM